MKSVYINMPRIWYSSPCVIISHAIYNCNPTLQVPLLLWIFFLTCCCYIRQHSHVANEDRKCNNFLICHHQFIPIIAIQAVKTKVLQPIRPRISPDESQWQPDVLHSVPARDGIRPRSSAHPAHAHFLGGYMER